MSKNTKATENKNTKATVKPATKKPVEAKKPAEQKPVEPKKEVVKFDKKAYGTKLIESFKNDTVDLVFDSDFVDDKKGGPRAEAMNDYKYIHVFRKGTTKNCFQIYLSSKAVTIVVGKNINLLMPESEKYVKQGVVKQGKLSYYNYLVKHDDVVEVLTSLVEAYKQNNEQAAKKKAEEEATKAEKVKTPKKEKKEKVTA